MASVERYSLAGASRLLNCDPQIPILQVKLSLKV